MRLPTVVIRSDVLESWLTVSDYSKARLADELGISKGRISQLLTSREEPSAHLIAKLMTLTYLPFDRLFIIVHDNAPPLLEDRLAAKNPKVKTQTSWAAPRTSAPLHRRHGSLSPQKGAQ